MRNIFLEVSERLNNLMETHTPPIKGIKRAPTLARLIHEAGLREDIFEKSMERSIDNHLNGCRMGIDYLKLYCDFFGCSADYLLGYIPDKTHELTDIAESTGLSEGAIECLKEMNDESKAVLNFLLEDDDALWVLLENMSKFQEAYNNNIDALQNVLDHPESNDAKLKKANADTFLNAAKGNMKEYCDMIVREWTDYVQSN